jgi:hypothetical protein
MVIPLTFFVTVKASSHGPFSQEVALGFVQTLEFLTISGRGKE